MFMLYAVVVGLIAGLAFGGRPRGLARIQFRWAWLVIACLMLQLVLFSAPVNTVVGDLGPPLYVGSTLVVLGVVLANSTRAPGLILVAMGAAANLAAIVANGGYMPAIPEVLVGRAATVGYSNSVELAQPALAPLVDRFVMPSGLPFANVFSVGDVVIGIGTVLVIVVAMVRLGTQVPETPMESETAASRAEVASAPQ
jgi:hypothetical protein